MKRFKLIFALIIILSLTISPCSVKPLEASEKAIKIGALLPLTGDWSEAGKGAQEALTVALPKVNAYLKDSGIKLDLDIRDTGSNADKALKNLKTMQKKGIHTVIGPMSSEESMSVLQFANEHSILLLSPSATSTDLSLKDNFFRLIATDVSQLDGLTKVIKNSDMTKLIMVYVDDNFGKGYYEQLKKKSEPLGIEMIGTVPLPLTSPDYAAAVSKLEEISADADREHTAVVLVSSGQSATKLIKKISSNSKLASMKWFAGADVIGSKSILAEKSVAAFAAKTRMEGYTIGYKDVALDALPYMDSVLDGAPELSPYAITTWDSLWLLAETYKQAPQKDIETLKKTLTSTAKNYRNAFGAINVMDENGDTISSRYMRYRLSAEGGKYTWHCLGHYINPGVGAPIIQTIEWNVAKDGGVVKVGALLPLKGSFSEKGKEIQSILKHSAETFNQYAVDCGSKLQIKLVIKDTQSDPQKALIAAQKLTAMGVKSIIGPINSSEMEKVKPLIDSTGIVAISPLSSSPSLSTNDRIYRLILNDTVQTKALAELMTKDKKKKVVLINCDDTYGNGIAEAFRSSFSGEVISLAYDSAHPDFASLLQKADTIVQEGTLSDTAVLAVTYDEIVDIMKQVKDGSNLSKVRWYGTDSTALSNALLGNKEAVQTALKVDFTAPDYTPYGKYFDPLYYAIDYKLRPSQPFKESSLSAFDGLWLLSCAYLEKGSSATSDVINDYVSKHSFRGVGGVLALDQNGDRQYGYYKLYHITATKDKYNWVNNGFYNLDRANAGTLEMFD